MLYASKIMTEMYFIQLGARIMQCSESLMVILSHKKKIDTSTLMKI